MKRINETNGLEFDVTTIISLLWCKRWTIILVTLLFIGLGVVVFKVTKKPQRYKYSMEFVLQYHVEHEDGQSTWVACERIPWKMVTTDYSKILKDSVFLNRLVEDGVLASPSLLLPVVVDNSDSLHVDLSVVSIEGDDAAVRLMSKIKELFPSYVVNLQREKLELEIYLLERKKEQLLSAFTDRGERLKSIQEKKNLTIVDQMEAQRLENESQMLYNLNLNVMDQIASVQLFMNDQDLLVLKANNLKKELFAGGLFSHLSTFILLFAFLGFMFVGNMVLLRAYFLNRK